MPTRKVDGAHPKDSTSTVPTNEVDDRLPDQASNPQTPGPTPPYGEHAVVFRVAPISHLPQGEGADEGAHGLTA